MLKKGQKKLARSVLEKVLINNNYVLILNLTPKYY